MKWYAWFVGTAMNYFTKRETAPAEFSKDFVK